jgi:hypothetical protein
MDTRKVVQRYKLSSTLTRNWLSRVKKGWKAVLASPHEPKDKFTILQEFLKNLREQVLYQKHGLDIIFEGSAGRQRFETLLAKTQAKLSQLSDEYVLASTEFHLASSVRDDFVIKIEKETGDNVRRLGDERFTLKYPTYKPFRDEWLKTMEALDQWRWYPEKMFGSLTRIFDELMKHLYADAKARADYESAGGQIDDRHLTIEKVFDLSGLKVVMIDDNIDQIDVRGYVKHLNRAQQLLANKGFGKLWYGVIFVEKKAHQKTPEEIELGKQWGYDNTANAGEYSHTSDKVYVQQPANGGVTGTVIHELGHRYWFKFMKPAQRARFNSLVQTKKTDKSRDFPQGPTTDEGGLKPVTPFGAYAGSNIEEAFAEVFEGYVTEGDLDRDQLESFRSVLATSAQIVARRFEQASRSKKITLGYQAVDIRTGKPLSDIFSKREPARAAVKILLSQGLNAGVQTVEAYVPSDWKRGDSLESYVDPETLEALKHKK